MAIYRQRGSGVIITAGRNENMGSASFVAPVGSGILKAVACADSAMQDEAASYRARMRARREAHERRGKGMSLKAGPSAACQKEKHHRCTVMNCQCACHVAH